MSNCPVIYGQSMYIYGTGQLNDRINFRLVLVDNNTIRQEPIVRFFDLFSIFQRFFFFSSGRVIVPHLGHFKCSQSRDPPITAEKAGSFVRAVRLTHRSVSVE